MCQCLSRLSNAYIYHSGMRYLTWILSIQVFYNLMQAKNDLPKDTFLICRVLCLYIQLCDSKTPGTIYNYRAQVLNEALNVDFSDFRGKLVLFVNVATYWSYTYQYKGKKWPVRTLCSHWKWIAPQWLLFFFIFPHWPSDLNALQVELRDSGFIILGFPSNQFGKQEPGSPSEILPGLKWETLSWVTI